ncbi:MAG TPA: translocation/assembly module TamB domain-containing protein [Chthonomonadaceae bacterium]|nr:translocation/assembly module TamB domain-containing protein [Chthonomonadaceae bacterium]
MRQLRFGINLVVLLIPLLILGIGASLLVRHVFAYLNSGARLAGVVSREATISLGHEVRVADVKITGNLWSLSANNEILLKDVAVAEGKTFASGTFVRADEVDVWYNLRQLLLTNDVHVSLMNAVRIIRPQLAIARNPQGQWNFTSFLKKAGPSGRPFVDKLTVLNGTVYYSDQAFPHPAGVPARPLSTRIDRFSGVLLMRPDKSDAFDFAGVGQPGIVRDFHAAGVLNPKPFWVDVRLAANGASLPFGSRRFVSPALAQVQTGLANLDASFLYTPQPGTPIERIDLKALTGHGSLQVFDLSGISPQLEGPVEGVNGTVDFTTDSALLHIAGNYLGSGVRLDGSILGLPHSLAALKSSRQNVATAPVLALDGAANNVDFARLVRSLHLAQHLKRFSPTAVEQLSRIQGRGNATFRLAGSYADPTGTLTAHLSSFAYDNYRMQNVDVSALLADRVINADVKGAYAGGHIAARAEIAADTNGAFRIEAHGRGLDLRKVGLPLKEPVSGMGQLDLAMQGRRGRTPDISAQAQLFHVKVARQTLDSVYARAQSTGRNLVVSALRVEDPKGFAQASGNVNLASRALSMNVSAEELDLSALLSTLHTNTLKNPTLQNILPATGVAYLNGKIDGTMSHPVAHGHVTAFALQAKGGGSYALATDFDASRDAVTLRNGRARRYLGQVLFAGTVLHPLTHQPDLHVSLQVQNLDVADLAHLAGIDTSKTPISGEISSEPILVVGTPSTFRIAHPFTLTLQNATADGLPITHAHAEAAYGPNGIDIRQASADVAEGTISLSGMVNRDKHLALNVRGDNLNLGALTAVLPEENAPVVGGHLTFAGHFAGTLSDPTAQLQTITGTDLTYNAFSLGTLQGQAAYANKRAVLQNVTLVDRTAAGPTGGRITIPDLMLDTATKRVATAAGQPIQVSAMPVSRLHDLFVSTPFANTTGGQQASRYLSRVSGAVSATIAVSGTVSDPLASVAWSTQDLAIDTQHITALTGSARVNKEEAVVPSLHIETAAPTGQPGGAVIDAHGDIHYRGSLSAEADAYNVDLALLQTLTQGALNPDYKVVGTATYLGVIASGKSTSPDLDVSLNLRNVGLQNIKSHSSIAIDSIDVSHATVQEGCIQADDVELAKNVSQTVLPESTVVTTKTAAPPPKLTPSVSVQHYTARARGTIGFTWKPPFVPADAPLDLQLDVPKQDIGIVSAFAPIPLDGTTGTLAATARVAGTRADPQLSGTLALQASRFRVAGAQTGLRDINGTFAFEGDHITANMTAWVHVFAPGTQLTSKTDSQLTLTGSLPLGLTREQHAAATGLRLTDGSLYFEEARLPEINSGRVRGTAAVNLALTGSLLRPTMGGTVNIHDANLVIPTSFGAAGTGAFAFPIATAFDLHVTVGNNVSLSGPFLNVRANGYVDLTGRWSESTLPRLQGRMALLSGYFSLPTVPRFTLLPPGDITVAFPVYTEGPAAPPTLALNVDLRARTNMTARSMYGVMKRYEVTVAVHGPIMGGLTEPASGQSRLQVSFSTNPPDMAATQQELALRIAGIVGTTGALSQFGSNPGQALAAELTNVFTSSVLPNLFTGLAQATGFEQISLNYDPVQQLSLTLSRRLFGPFYVSYTRSLSAVQNYYDLKLSLRFKNNYQLSWESVYESYQPPTQQILLEGVWKF